MSFKVYRDNPIVYTPTPGFGFTYAVLDVIESLPEHKTERLRAWVEEAKSGHIYAYVQFYSVFRFSYGLIMTTGGPRDRLIATEEIGENEIDNVRPKWDFSDAIRAARMMGRAGGLGTRAAKVRGYFEEKPMVEVDNENEYDQVLVAMDISLEDGAWEGPGIYNFHNSPPSYQGTLDDYEREAMMEEAEATLATLFASEDVRYACETLLKKS